MTLLSGLTSSASAPKHPTSSFSISSLRIILDWISGIFHQARPIRCTVHSSLQRLLIFEDFSFRRWAASFYLFSYGENLLLQSRPIHHEPLHSRYNQSLTFHRQQIRSYSHSLLRDELPQANPSAYRSNSYSTISLPYFWSYLCARHTALPVSRKSFLQFPVRTTSGYRKIVLTGDRLTAVQGLVSLHSERDSWWLRRYVRSI